jgi:hypothetical protein
MSTDNELTTRTEADAEEEYEDEEGYEEADTEEYERWVTVDRPDFRFKPLVIGLVICGVIGGAAVVLATSLPDPADKFDSAPVLQDPSEAKTALSITGSNDRSFSVEMPEDRPRAARAVQATAAAAPVADEQPAAEPPTVEPAPAVEETVPEPPVEAEPAPAEPQPQAETAGYDEVLELARMQRNRRQKEELLRQAIELNPEGDEALATLAMMLMERGKTRTEALDLATRAVDANPDNGLGWLVIGYVKQVIGKAAEAKDAYRKCAGCSGPKKYVRECRLLG